MATELKVTLAPTIRQSPGPKKDDQFRATSTELDRWTRDVQTHFQHFQRIIEAQATTATAQAALIAAQAAELETLRAELEALAATVLTFSP